MAEQERAQAAAGGIRSRLLTTANHKINSENCKTRRQVTFTTIFFALVNRFGIARMQQFLGT